MTTRRRVTHKAEELAKERRQIAMRRAVAAISDRFARQSLRDLVIALDRAGGAETLVTALRKHMRATRVPDIGGTPRPDPAIWSETVGGKPGGGGGG